MARMPGPAAREAGMSSDRGDRDRQAEAERTLARIAADSEVVGTSRLAAVARRMRSRLTAEDKAAADPVERWATRAGRGLGAFALLALAVYLLATYVFP